MILPAENKKDFMEDVPEEIRTQLDAHFVSLVDEVLRLALTGKRKPIKAGKDT